ncbi:DUSAM domain-containing protein [Myxococcus xanthus]|uniref:DUSAM domain-containing protein n=1 Tax=Myxococcus xanthus TaxID=34 RepID=A0A7Y4MTT1_MYXXA|nr:DUSAM domain-containing protein [Myxococcus xanthus]NOJ81900.1 DUSAM domain-containing protein [Myxococcus xanthus]NOJ89273.1 DUSAM domain-containing protein [Myxococcus xanthus]
MAESIDWDPVRELARRVEAGEALSLTAEVRALLLRSAREVGISDAEAHAAVAGVATATALLHETRRRIRDGSQRLMRALTGARRLRDAGDAAGARALLEDVLAVEQVPLYREQAELALEDLA